MVANAERLWRCGDGRMTDNQTAMDLTILLLIAVSLALLVSAVVGALFLRRRGHLGNQILILGEINSGKTALFYHLQGGGLVPTVSSMEPNSLEFLPPQLSASKQGKPLRIVDFPGHGSQRVRLNAFLGSVRGIIFMVDATAPKELPDVALFLYSVLSHPHVAKKRIPLLIARNKVDDPKARPLEEIVDQLSVRVQQLIKDTDTMADIGDTEADRVQLGDLTQDKFDFSAGPSPVTFDSISVKQSSVRPVIEFLEKL